MVASIERFLVRWDDGHETISEELGTPVNLRAHDALSSFLDSGWLSIDRVGFTQFMIMRPTVQSLFELLKTFAEQGPEFIGGRVQSVRNNLLQVLADPEKNAAVFQVAAKECSALLRMLNTTRMRVREASEYLRAQESTHLFLEKFFGDYISSLYIGDYSDLFSRNHPLASRWDIVDLASRITEEPESREQLRRWYRKNLRCRSNEEADVWIDSDTAHVLALREVDRLLARLKDAVISRLRSRLLSVLRSPLTIPFVLSRVCNALAEIGDLSKPSISISCSSCSISVSSSLPRISHSSVSIVGIQGQKAERVCGFHLQYLSQGTAHSPWQPVAEPRYDLAIVLAWYRVVVTVVRCQPV